MPDDNQAIADMIDDILSGRAVPPPRSFVEDKKPLVAVVEALGSQDPATRAAASAAVDTYLKKLGLAWKDIADAIEVMSSVENWQSEGHERAPRRDTLWARFVDNQERGGYGRWMKGRALTVREHGASWFIAINAHVVRDYAHKPRLFRSAQKAQSAAEAFAIGELN